MLIEVAVEGTFVLEGRVLGTSVSILSFWGWDGSYGKPRHPPCNNNASLSIRMMAIMIYHGFIIDVLIGANNNSQQTIRAHKHHLSGGHPGRRMNPHLPMVSKLVPSWGRGSS